MPRTLLAAVLGAGLTLAGCTRGPSRADEVRFVERPPPAPATPSAPSSAPSAPPQTAPPTQPPAPVDEGPPVVLSGAGLTAALRFGSPTDEVIAGLTLRWGPPDGDSGWIPTGGPEQPFGAGCPGTRVRGVNWGQFYVLFSDGPTPHGPGGREHFFTWLYYADDPDDPRPDPGGNRPPLRTAAGISVAATVAELGAAYGTDLNLYDETTEEGVATGGPAFAAAGVFGSLTSTEPAGRVRSIVGGGGCGP